MAGDVDGGGRPVVHARRATGSSRTSRPSRSAVRCTSSRSTRIGQPFVITDSSGKVISRDRGNLTGQLHVRLRHRRVQLPRGPAPRTAPDVRCRPVPGRRTAHGGISDSAQYLTRAADRLDRLAGGLRRIPAAELHGDRRAEPAAPVLPRLRRDGRRHARGDREARLGGHPEVHQRRRLADRPTVRRPCPAARRGSAGLRLLVVRRRTVRRLVQHAGPARPRERATCLLHDAGRGPRLHRLRGAPTTTSTRRGCTSPACRAARSASGSTWGSTAAICKVAAAVPIAGEGRPACRGRYCGLGETPIWAFTGLLEDTVDPQGSIEPLTALQDCPASRPTRRS